MRECLIVLLVALGVIAAEHTGAKTDTQMVRKQLELYYSADTSRVMYVDSADSVLKPTGIKYNKTTKETLFPGVIHGKSDSSTYSDTSGYARTSPTVVSQGTGVTVVRSSDTFTVSLYQPPVISSLTNTMTSNYVGQTVTGLTVNWSLSGSAITGQTLTDAGTLSTVDRSHVFTGLSVTDTRTYTLSVTDGVTPVSATSSAYFYIAKFRDTTSNAVPTEANIEAGYTTWVILGTSNRALAATTITGSGKYIYYSYPSFFGTVQIYVNGFATTWNRTTVSVTNAYGDTRDYYVYTSPTTIIGTIAISAVAN